MVKAGEILVRQRGSVFFPGSNVGMGKDYTLYSLIEGYIQVEKCRKTRKKFSVYTEKII